MIKKSNGIKLPNQKSLLLNGGIILVVAASLIAAAKISFYEESVAPCSQRYSTALQMGLERSGQMMRPSELQAHLSNTDWNVVEHVRIVPLKGGSVPHALAVDTGFPQKVQPEHASSDEPKPRSGVGFLWTPHELPRTGHSCLAYSIRVPGDFDFGGGGQLPGVYGTMKRPDLTVRAPDFSVRNVWDAGGNVGVIANVLDLEEGKAPTNLPQSKVDDKFAAPLVSNDRTPVKLQRGEWSALEQEVVMNDPGHANGVIRVWVNGQISFERTNLAFRTDDQGMITGVFAEVVAKPAGNSPAPKGEVILTPFEMRW